MKKTYLLIICILAVINGFCQKESITLTFKALDSITSAPQVLDSVYVENLAENCDTSLYSPVSSLTLNVLHVGIFEHSYGPETFIVMQNGPNPFEGSTSIRIFQKKSGDLNLSVTDNQGRQLSSCQKHLERGWHTFGVSANGSQLLMVNISDNVSSKTLRLLSTGGSEENLLSYTGSSSQAPLSCKSGQAGAVFIFYMGNQLVYHGYVQGFHECVIPDHPDSDTTYTFTMVPISTPPFVCGTVLNYGGQDYNTVQIDTQCWLKENLNIGTMLLTPAVPADNGIIEKHCMNNLPANCLIYGGLYYWNEMMQYSLNPGVQGICPSGWHVPTDNEISTLVSYLAGTSVAGGAMKETGTEHWVTPNGGATNSSGFTALGAGCLFYQNQFSWFQSTLRLSTSTHGTGVSSWFWDLNNANATIDRLASGRDEGTSVRCIKD
jgi:uncharacterized protein (TIGR02145 family)